MSPERKVLARYQTCYRATSKSGPREAGDFAISGDLQALLDVLAQLPNPPIVVLVASSEISDDCERSPGANVKPTALLAVQNGPTEQEVTEQKKATEQKKTIERTLDDRALQPLRVIDLDILPAISLEVQLGFSTGWFQPALRAFSACVTTCATRCLTAVAQPRFPGTIDGAPRHLIRRGLRSLQKSLAAR